MNESLSLAGVAEVLRTSDRPLAQSLELGGHPTLTLRDEANAITSFAFRNGFLEDLHAGKPSPLLDDPSYSRITDAEMRKLMIESSAMVSRWLYLRTALMARNPDGYCAFLASYLRHFCRDWDRKKRHVKLRRQRVTVPCFACGEPLVPAWRFCPHCGQPNT